MTEEKTGQIPAVEGWFTMPPEEPRIIVTKCSTCGDVAFPPGGACRNPDCSKEGGVERVPLGRTGKLETFTVNHYPPPPPFHASDPYVPIGVAAVVMDGNILIKAQVATGFEQNLKIGMDMEVVVETLYIDDKGNDVLAYKFRPVE